jgi:hypothetical protein
VQRPIERPVCEGELRRNSRRFAGKRAVRSRAWRLHRSGRARHWTVRAGHRGTLFLDEIGDLPLELQPKILRVMQERQFERLGGAATIHTDVRVICATHRNLVEMVDEREFRADLFYRLSVFPIELPPLRERPEDIRLLVHHFAMDYAARMRKPIVAISEEFMAALARHSWPGNVRELQNFIERSVILSKGACAEWFAARTDRTSKASAPVTLEEAERSHILQTLQQTAGRGRRSEWCRRPAGPAADDVDLQDAAAGFAVRFPIPLAPGARGRYHYRRGKHQRKLEAGKQQRRPLQCA